MNTDRCFICGGILCSLCGPVGRAATTTAEHGAVLHSGRIVRVPSTPLLVLLIAAPVWAQLPEKLVLRPEGTPATSAVAVNGIVYLSGVAPRAQAASTRLAIKEALAGVGTVLRSAGLDYRHVVFCNPYLAPAVPRADLDIVYRQFFEFGNTPARATLDMNALPGGAPIALSAVAVADLERRRVVRPISRELSPTASPAVFAGDALYLSGFSGF